MVSGQVQVETETGRVTLHKRDYFDIPASGATITNSGQSMAELVRVMGHWDHTVRNEICMFRPENPCDYHYHDGDEYWVIFRGHFTLDYNGMRIPVGPGDLLAAGKGIPHGALAPEETMNGIVMAMPLEDGRSATATSTTGTRASRRSAARCRRACGTTSRRARPASVVIPD